MSCRFIGFNQLIHRFKDQLRSDKDWSFLLFVVILFKRMSGFVSSVSVNRLLGFDSLGSVSVSDLVWFFPNRNSPSIGLFHSISCLFDSGFAQLGEDLSGVWVRFMTSDKFDLFQTGVSIYWFISSISSSSWRVFHLPKGLPSCIGIRVSEESVLAILQSC